jgi:hypothetical protein
MLEKKNLKSNTISLPKLAHLYTINPKKFILTKNFYKKYSYKNIALTNLTKRIKYTDIFLPSNILINPSSINTYNTQLLVSDSTLGGLEDHYDLYKQSLHLYSHKKNNPFILENNFLQPKSFYNVISFFSNNVSDNDWLLDNFSKKELIFNYTQLNNKHLLLEDFKVRKLTKNVIVTYNAVQKIFKSKLDENRSNVKVQDLLNSKLTYPSNTKLGNFVFELGLMAWMNLLFVFFSFIEAYT